jgi:D-3-phosphoglycerate dehydrogenase
VFANHNVDKQYSDSKGEIAYLMADITQVTEEQIADLYNRIISTRANIKTRLLY